MIDKYLRIIARQHWIRLGIRNRLLKIFCNPDTVLSKEFETDFFGLKYKGNFNSYIDCKVFYYGVYEREYLLFLRNLVQDKSNSIFIDIGANVGQHSLFMSMVCDEVHSFEPNPVVSKRLGEKISVNHKSNIIVHEVGLGIKDEELPFFPPKGSNHGTGSFIEKYSNNNEEKPILLKVVNGDQYISRLVLAKVDLIKIDVEGYEKYVLTGLKETLKQYRPLIAMEYSATTQESFVDAEEFMKLLPSGYRVKKISCNNSYAKVFNNPICILEEFDFKLSGGNLLLYPSETEHFITKGDHPTFAASKDT